MTTVLIVEDQEEIAALLKFKLKNSGYEVVHAENGKLGLEAARNNRPDLILLDVMMPVMNGLDALKALKSDDNLKSVPVIMLSAQASEPAVVEGFKLGADDYITKPFRANEFIARVEAVLSRYKKDG
ncbi:MAG TPA: response regulator [Candidatus Acidoferrales bacterium]|nr:response regulator [Candidatus Acidoferrales bacterium]